MTVKHTPEPIGSYRAQLGESPVWDDGRDRLLWIDGLRSRILLTNVPDGDGETFTLPARPGSIALTQSGKMIAALGQQIALVTPGEPPVPLATLEPGTPGRFNDGKPDASGRLWVGTASAEGLADCALYCFAAGSSPEPVVPGIRMSNGLGWSSDNRTLYYVDTGTARLDAFDLELSTGTLSRRRTVLQLASGQLPDGLTVDSEGRIYLAVWGQACVLALTPDGRIERKIELPTPRVSSCTFGGSDYRTLFITTAQEGATAEELAADPLAGALFAVEIGAQGLPPNRFRMG